MPGLRGERCQEAAVARYKSIDERIGRGVGGLNGEVMVAMPSPACEPLAKRIVFPRVPFESKRVACSQIHHARLHRCAGRSAFARGNRDELFSARRLGRIESQ